MENNFEKTQCSFENDDYNIDDIKVSYPSLNNIIENHIEIHNGYYTKNDIDENKDIYSKEEYNLELLDKSLINNTTYIIREKGEVKD